MTENPRIKGIDWQGLQKGDLIPHDQVKEFFHSIFPNDEWNEFSMVRVINKLMKLREAINRPLVIKSINKDNLDPSKQRDLETKQIHHAFIASAADGARKESLQLQRKGERLPKSLIEKSEFKKSS